MLANTTIRNYENISYYYYANTFNCRGNMYPIEFSFQVILISISGVLSPGPLFFINLLYGSKYGSFVGLKIALGNTIVEFPLIIILSYSLYTFSSFNISDVMFKFIGLIGETFVLIFSIFQINSILSDKKINQAQEIINTKFARNPILIGFIFTLSDPFFLYGGLLLVQK